MLKMNWPKGEKERERERGDKHHHDDVNDVGDLINPVSIEFPPKNKNKRKEKTSVSCKENSFSLHFSLFAFAFLASFFVCR